ncbi:hypothetical protein F511_40423 [Dorcoceras hygrometricum]|uniref:Uncharacterized protein n=1 Tax=Dorcoceras hygrometricum TaxID=472368 RepID=A0A2Z7C243_9LAMI|nr:hypothetical protein F511_40423 [Dorcoceras hygrometricum]
MSSWTQSARAFHKLQEIQKSAHDRTGLGFSKSKSSEGERSTQSQPVYDKFNKMSFVKADVIYDCFESITYDDHNSPKLSDNGKSGIGFSKPESSKPNWLKNKLDKDKAKAGQKPFVPKEPWHSSKKVKTGWKNTQPRRDLYGQHMKSKLNRSHCNYAQTLKDTYTGKTVKGEDITGAVSGKFFSISQAQFAHVFELPTEGLVNFFEVRKDRVYDARSIFSKKGVQVEIHGKKKHMKYEFRLLNDILAKAVTVKAGSFDAVTTEQFQMMTAIHFGLKLNWRKVLFNGIPVIALGGGVPFPSAKILSMKTVNTYIATNTTIDAREEQGMVSEAIVKRKSKSTKKSSFADDTPVKVISEIAGSKKRVATEDNAPAIPKKRRTVKTKPSPSQASLDIVNVAQDVVPIQVIDPTPAVATIKSPAPKQKSRKRRFVLPTGSDDETMCTQELAKDTDEAAVKPTDEVDITIEQVLEETLKLGANEEEHGGQSVDEALFADDFAQWLDDFVSRNSEPEIVGTRTITEAAGRKSPVVVKDMNRAVSSMFTNKEHMPIDDLLLKISDDMLLPSITAIEITKI